MAEQGLVKYYVKQHGMGPDIEGIDGFVTSRSKG